MRTSTRSLAALVILAGFGAWGVRAEEAQKSSVLFQQLRSPKTTDQATARLIELAKRDKEVRKYLATHLPSAIQKESGQPWMNAVRLAGELKIEETAPALAKWISLDNIGEITTAQYVKLETNPAGKALSQIGDPAIPTLVGVLEQGNLHERRNAVYVLNLIASSRATNALREHLKRETDPDLRDFIQKAIGR